MICMAVVAMPGPEKDKARQNEAGLYDMNGLVSTWKQNFHTQY
jgi:formylglycine-generating enzyme required for sulfatase activity